MRSFRLQFIASRRIFNLPPSKLSLTTGGGRSKGSEFKGEWAKVWNLARFLDFGRKRPFLEHLSSKKKHGERGGEGGGKKESLPFVPTKKSRG